MKADPKVISDLQSNAMALAFHIQESGGMMNSEIVSGLGKAVRAAHQSTGQYAYYLDHNGDEDSGDVTYQCGEGDAKQAPYSKGTDSSDDDYAIDTDKAVKVRMTHAWEEIPDEADHYASMSEAFVRDKLYTEMPLYERFVSKKERDAASSDDFAGKGKSFPILKAADVAAAFHSLGRSGADNYSVAVIRKNIIRIAKAKGFPLPKSAQEDSTDAKEAARLAAAAGGLRLVEAAGFCADVPLVESARVNYPIKLISPGTGTMAHYPAKALEEAAPLFKPGTLMFWNHPTAAEESARPEGDLNNLAAITTTPARWDANGVKGPGLYAEAKVMADYADRVAERAPHIGLSIRAGGEGTGRMVDGKPELKKITYVESVDYVTKAGRGGLALAEAARNAGILPKPTQEASMDAEELKLLRESVARLSGKEMRREAIQEGARILRDVDLPDAAKEYVIETVLKEALPLKDGALDVAKLTESVNAEAKRFGAAIGAGSRVTGMGAGAPVVEITEAQRKAQAEAREAEAALYRESWATLLDEQPDKDGRLRLAEVAVRGRTA